MQVIAGENYLTTREVADVLGIHPVTVRGWRSDGRDPIGSHRFGSSVLYKESEVLAYLEAHGKPRPYVHRGSK